MYNSERDPGRYYLKFKLNRSEEQEKLNERIFALCADLSLPVIATNDSHFLKAENHDAHDVLLCIGLGKEREDRHRIRYDRGLYFKNHLQIAELIPGRTYGQKTPLELTERCTLVFTKT